MAKFGENGHKGNLKGRPKGTPNKITLAVREVAQGILDGPYMAKLRDRVVNGKAPQMEVLLWHYAWGKPPEADEDQAKRSVSLLPILIAMGPEFVTAFTKRLIADSGQTIDAEIVDGNGQK